ncbi:MAG: hypothetical protein RIB45_03580 [Marivibrio sp.]|uniref:hypothetical protein n=1 Tax=Marivibrio sp. TaxID=2039719 RepID=UPI0032EC57EC
MAASDPKGPGAWLAAVQAAAGFKPLGAATRSRMAAADGYDPYSRRAANEALGTPAAFYRVMGGAPEELDETACLMRLTLKAAEAAAALAALRADLDADPAFEESAAAYLDGFDPQTHHLFIAYAPEDETPVGYVRWQCALSAYPVGDAPAEEPRLILSVYPELFYVRPAYRERRIGAALAGAIQAEVDSHIADVLTAMAQVDFPGRLTIVFFAEVESEGGAKLIDSIATSLDRDLKARHAAGDFGTDVPPIEVSLEHREKQTPTP